LPEKRKQELERSMKGVTLPGNRKKELERSMKRGYIDREEEKRAWTVNEKGLHCPRRGKKRLNGQ